MTTRRERRRRRQLEAQESSLGVRAIKYATSWEAIIGLSILVVLAVFVQGVFHLSLPFDLGKSPPLPDPWGYVNVPRGSPLKLAYIEDASQNTSPDTPGAKQAIELALNEHGKVHNISVELQVVADTCDEQAATDQAQALAQDPQVVGVISGACEASTLAAKDVFEEVKLPYLSLSNTDPALTEPGTLVTFRLLWNVKAQGRQAALYARQTLKTNRALLLHDGSSRAVAVLNEFRDNFRPQGGQVVDLRAIDPQGTGWDNVTKESKNLEADMVYFSGNGKTAGALAAFLHSDGYVGKFMATDAAFTDPEYLNTGQAVEGTYVSMQQVPRSASYAFWKEGYEKEYGPVGPLAPEAYDATLILLRTLDSIATLEKDGTLKIGRLQLAGTIRSLPYEGVSGKASFDANGDRGSILAQVMKVENGQFQPVQ